MEVDEDFTRGKLIEVSFVTYLSWGERGDKRRVGRRRLIEVTAKAWGYM